MSDISKINVDNTEYNVKDPNAVRDNPVFSEASTRVNIASGESFATILGKIKKFFADLKTVAFTGAYSDLSGTPTIPDVSTKYDSSDSAETTLADDDKVPFYDTSASGRRNSTWANIKAKLKAYLDTVYLPLTGGTLTGNLNVSGSSDTSLYTHGNASGSHIGFRNQAGNTTYGYIGVKNDNLPYFYANSSKRIALLEEVPAAQVNSDWNASSGVAKILNQPTKLSDFTNDLTLLKTVDFSDGTAYVPQTEHLSAMIACVRENNANVGLGSATYGGNILAINWGNGNWKYNSELFMGCGDKPVMYFRGKNTSQTDAYCEWQQIVQGHKDIQKYYNKYEVDLSTGDVNTFYPVTGTSLSNYYVGYVHMTVCVALNSGTVPSWSTHKDGFSVFLDILNEAMGWGRTAGRGICLANGYQWCNSSPCGYSQMTNSSTPVFWCRGGGKYFIYSDHPMAWSVRTSTYTVSGQSVAPMSTNPGVSFPMVSDIMANITGNAATATKATQDGDGNTISSTYLKKTGGGNVAGDVHFTGQLYAEGWGLVIGTSSSRGQAYFVQGNYAIQIYPFNLSADRSIVIPDTNGTFSVSGSSSRRTKKNIENMTDVEAKKLLELRPVKFDYITEEDGTDCYGLIAEEVQDVGIEYPVFTHHDKRLDEDVPALEYSKFVPYLIKMVQIQQKEIDVLKAEIAEIKRQL